MLSSEMYRTCFPGFSQLLRTSIAVLLLTPVPVRAQDVTQPALRAAFIYNFAKFTTWPIDAVPVAEPLVICVLSDAAVGDALERAVKGRELAGHSVAVLRMATAGPHQVCHVLYVSGVTAGEAAQLVAGLRDAPVLTISDAEGFTERGGIVQFFFEQNRLRFGVHVESARRAHLQISSTLLALARLN